MHRRHIAKSALVGAAAVALPLAAFADADEASMNVVFTNKDPGHWKDVEALHVPIITVTDGKMTVTTPHPMSEPHYIVSHSVVLGNGMFLDRKTFNWKEQPVSTHALPAGYRGKVTVTSTCNLHDFWVRTSIV